MSKLTCGVIFEKEGKILVGHVTGQKHWDLPKGKQEEGETSVEAAVREVKEETGLDIEAYDLASLGVFPYRRGKQIELFVHRGENVKAKDCREAIKDFKVKELDDFKFVDFGELHEYLNERMRRALGRALFNAARYWREIG